MAKLLHIWGLAPDLDWRGVDAFAVEDPPSVEGDEHSSEGVPDWGTERPANRICIGDLHQGDVHP